MTVQFGTRINRVYDYFQSVGIDGKKAGMLVTDTLELMHKPTLFGIRIGPFSLRRFWAPHTNASRVLESIRTQLSGHPELPNETRQMAEFVVKILQSIQTNKDPHFARLMLHNRWRTNERAQFESSLTRVENYLATLGVDGKAADSYLTHELKLIPKPNWLLRRFWTSAPPVTEVTEQLRSFVSSKDIPQELRAHAETIASLFERIASKQDPKLEKLGLINQLDLAIQQAHHLVDKAPFSAFLAQTRAAYIRGELGQVDADAMKRKLHELTQLGSVARESIVRIPIFGASVPQDVLRLVFQRLPAAVASRSRRVCKRWNALISEKRTWEEIAKRQGSQVLFSSFRQGDSPDAAFQQNRAQVVALPHACFRAALTPLRSICQQAALSNWKIIPNRQLLVLADSHHFHVWHENRFVQIHRNAATSALPIDGQLYTIEGRYQVHGGVLVPQVAIAKRDLATGHPTQRITIRPSAPAIICTEGENGDKMLFGLRNGRYGILDLATGGYSEVTDPDIQPDMVTRMRLSNGHSYVIVNDNQLRIANIQPEGVQQKVIEVPGITSVPWATNKVCFVASNTPLIRAIDIATGATIARYYLSGIPVGAKVQQGMLFVEFQTRVEVFDLLTTKRIHTFGLSFREWCIYDGKFYQFANVSSKDPRLVLKATDIRTPRTVGTEILKGLDTLRTVARDWF